MLLILNAQKFSKQEYWSGLPFPSPGDLPGPGIEPGSPAFQADALTSKPPEKPKNKQKYKQIKIFLPDRCFMLLILNAQSTSILADTKKVPPPSVQKTSHFKGFHSLRHPARSQQKPTFL